MGLGTRHETDWLTGRKYLIRKNLILTHGHMKCHLTCPFAEKVPCGNQSPCSISLRSFKHGFSDHGQISWSGSVGSMKPRRIITGVLLPCQDNSDTPQIRMPADRGERRCRSASGVPGHVHFRCQLSNPGKAPRKVNGKQTMRVRSRGRHYSDCHSFSDMFSENATELANTMRLENQSLQAFECYRELLINHFQVLAQ
jgi:hypothetical protein